MSAQFRQEYRQDSLASDHKATLSQGIEPRGAGTATIPQCIVSDEEGGFGDRDAKVISHVGGADIYNWSASVQDENRN
jgi:hypothetical protein